jgi:hypothetical protein
VCRKCKENVDARAPLRPLGLVNLRRLRGEAAPASRPVAIIIHISHCLFGTFNYMFSGAL